MVNAAELPIRRFRRLPLEMEAIEWDGTETRLGKIQQWVASDGTGYCFTEGPAGPHLGQRSWWIGHPRKGWSRVRVGDLVARDLGRQRFYPISPEAVAATWEPVEPDAPLKVNYYGNWIPIPGESDWWTSALTAEFAALRDKHREHRLLGYWTAAGWREVRCVYCNVPLWWAEGHTPIPAGTPFVADVDRALASQYRPTTKEIN